ncbi:hypothetical protein HRbin32_00486 [bacterium HR32]|nr:hypothetical protein HRbin32_00486 [bacterium HR32]
MWLGGKAASASRKIFVLNTSMPAGSATTAGTSKLSTARTKFSVAAARTAGTTRGTVTRRAASRFPEPDIRAASSREGSMDRRAAATTRNAKGVSTSPSTNTMPPREYTFKGGSPSHRSRVTFRMPIRGLRTRVHEVATSKGGSTLGARATSSNSLRPGALVRTVIHASVRPSTTDSPAAPAANAKEFSSRR